MKRAAANKMPSSVFDFALKNAAESPYRQFSAL
jgi:hypothetical protein